MSESLKLLVLGAHPDDAEFHAGGLAVRYRRLGHFVKFVSVTDGSAGHHQRSREELAQVRRHEAAESAAVIGAASEVWSFPDGQLTPSLEVREHIIREIRLFRPDLVLTHRPCDYHPDHRAVGQAVQDACYLVTVPLIVPDTPHLARDPVVAYLPDPFSKPYPMQADVLLEISAELEAVVRMLACHQSQVFEWLPYNHGIADQVPHDPHKRLPWLDHWFRGRLETRRRQWHVEVQQSLGAVAQHWIEAFEMSEYAACADRARLERLFPGGVVLKSDS